MDIKKILREMPPFINGAINRIDGLEYENNQLRFTIARLIDKNSNDVSEIEFTEEKVKFIKSCKIFIDKHNKVQMVKPF